MMTPSWEEYLTKQRDANLQELVEFLKIPSVSTATEHKSDIRKAAEWAAGALERAGLEHVQVLPTQGNPVVYADWLHAEGKPTVLVYGHYDVQPADPLDQWQSPPFEPEVLDGQLYARGATDDKGQLFLHVKAVEALLKTSGNLPVNLKFCVEGEEEIASPNLPAFIEEQKELLRADAIVISDGPMLAPGKPAIDYALRGLCGIEINVQGVKHDLHSGLFGGGVPNAVNALAAILGSFFGPDGKVAVEGFYDDVTELSADERARLAAIPFDEAEIRRNTGAAVLPGEKGYTYLERTTARPTLDIVGMSGGFAGEGIKPIIPAKAQAKVTCRLVNNQRPDKIMDLLETHIRSYAPEGVDISIRRIVKGNPYYASYEHPYFKAASQAYLEEYGAEPKYVRCGGSIRVVEVFSRILGTIVVLLNFGLPDEQFHSPNEHFSLTNFDKGMRTICRYWELLGRA